VFQGTKVRVYNGFLLQEQVNTAINRREDVNEINAADDDE
jgi:hypothetical protein